MKKILGLILVMVISLSAVWVWAQDKPYVRKQLQPSFFMPESAKPKPEKLPMPRYTEGQAESVKAVNHNDVSGGRVEDEELAGNEEIMQDLQNTPEYQKKYEDYNQDLEQISKTGEIPENEVLQEDLEQMNSEEPQAVVEYPVRDVKAEFQKALDESLKSNN